MPAIMMTSRIVAPLDPDLAPTDPYALFTEWFEAARRFPVAQPEAMTLATVDADGMPDARTVLMRGVDAQGFRFYTNYTSAKGRALAAHPVAALLFHWEPLERQVRIRGAALRLPDAESDAYFADRPRLSQLGAWASPQSEIITSRAELEARVAGVEARFADRPVTRPPHWGGFLVRTATIEFWQGQPGRLHDRVRYRSDGDAWIRERLAP